MAKTIGSFDLASLKNLRDDVTQYFWFESDSSSAWGSGAHVTLYPESQFTDSTNPNYMKGQNIIMNTDGFSIRNGALPMMVLDNDSLDFNIIDTSLDTYTTIANFGINGVNIGLYADINDTKVVITSGGFDLIKATGKSGHTIISEKTIAHLGDDYATIGSRAIGTTIGNQSIVIGTRCEASGYRSVAEGSGTVASGEVAHAEGANSVANKYASHAEGQNTTASGPEAHAEGNDTLARGYESHAQNGGTIAQGYRQTAIGSYNIAQGVRAEIRNTDHAFIIGNGNGIDGDPKERSNAFVVDWDGNVVASGGLTLEESYSLADYVVETGTSGDWTYRKWRSGRMEAEGDASVGSTWTAVGSAGIYHANKTLTPPTGMTVTSGYANAKMASQYLIGGHIQIGANVVLEVHRLASSSATISYHVTLIGTYS